MNQCQHCQSTTGVVQRVTALGETQSICAECVVVARWFPAWFLVHLRELAAKKEAAA